MIEIRKIYGILVLKCVLKIRQFKHSVLKCAKKYFLTYLIMHYFLNKNQQGEWAS